MKGRLDETHWMPCITLTKQTEQRLDSRQSKSSRVVVHTSSVNARATHATIGSMTYIMSVTCQFWILFLDPVQSWLSLSGGTVADVAEPAPDGGGFSLNMPRSHQTSVSLSVYRSGIAQTP